MRRLQIAQRCLSGVSGCANGFLGTLSLGYVGVDQHEAAIWHWIAARFDDTAIGPCTLDAQLPPRIFVGAAQFSLQIGCVLAALSKIAEIFGIGWPPRKERVGQLKHVLEIAIPRGKSLRRVEHDHPVAHIVEGNTQLGLAVTQLLKQPRIFDRDHRLVGEGAGELDLLVSKRFDAGTVNGEYAEQGVAAQQGPGRQVER